MNVLQVEGLTKTYGKGENQVKALDGVSFEVQKGTFLAIVGASGSGKSTLLHLLGGVDRPCAGSVIVDGVGIHQLKEDELAIFRRRKIGFVFQSFNLIPVLTAQENIGMPLLLDGRRADREYNREVVGVLDLLSLKDRRHHLPSELSGGQQQRVAIGRALINRPAIVLADEPTGNLDSKSSKETMEVLKYSVRKYNQTLILITHDLGIAGQADRVITLSDGRIIGDEVMA